MKYMTMLNAEDGAGSLAVALEGDLTEIARQQPRAVGILQQCAFLAPRAIPDALFTRSSAANDTVNGAAGAITMLLDHGLITRRDQVGQFDMLLSLQEAVRRLMPVDQQQERVEQALCALEQYISSLGEDTTSDRICSTVSHVQYLAAFSEEWTLSRQEAAEVFGWAAEILYRQGNMQEAEPLLRQALPIWERVLGSTHPHIGMVLFNLAGLNSRLKNYPRAEFFAQWSIRVQSQTSPVNHTRIIFGLNHLGALYAEQGKQNEAKLCYRKALALGEKARLQGHPLRITAAYELAMLEIAQERFADAEPLLYQVCIDWKQSPNVAYPSTIQAWQAFARVSCELEKWQQAEECYRRLLPIYEQKLSPDSPELASWLNDLAEVLIVQRQFVEALPFLEQAWDIYETRLGVEDLKLSRILMNLSAVYAVQQNHTQAILCLERSLAIKTRILGDDHTDLVEDLDALATLYTGQNRLEETEAMLRRALTISEQKTEASGMERVGRLLALGQVSWARDLPAQAQEYFQQALAVVEAEHIADQVCPALFAVQQST